MPKQRTECRIEYRARLKAARGHVGKVIRDGVRPYYGGSLRLYMYRVRRMAAAAGA
jgi:hypothetical protein